MQAYLLAADESMSPAATEVKEISEKQKEITSFPGEDSLTDCTVSLDGSWQKREHDSLDGIATAINRLEWQSYWLSCNQQEMQSVPNLEQKQRVPRI